MRPDLPTLSRKSRHSLKKQPGSGGHRMPLLIPEKNPGPPGGRSLLGKQNASTGKLGQTASVARVVSVEAIWRHMAVGLIVSDSSQRITIVNPAARRLAEIDPQGMRLDQAPLIWGRMLDLSGREVPAHEWPTAKAMHGETTTQQDCRLVHASGTYRDVLFSAAPLGLTDSRAAGVIATLTDVTDFNRRALGLREQAVRRERSRMAEDIHDSFCQGINAVLLQLQAAQDSFTEGRDAVSRHLRVAFDVARETLAEARRSMWTFSHESLDNVDPVSAVSELAKHAVRGTPISLNLFLPQHPRLLPPQVPLEFLRLIQEALSNVVKHSKASRVQVKLAYKGRALHLLVLDDGRGFDRAASIGLQNGFGLISMQQRAERLGGRITVYSRPGKGTRVAAVIPLPAVPA